MKLIINGQEIKFTTLEWSGSKYNAARRISASYPANLAYKFKQGNTVTLSDGSNTLFKGYVFRVEKAFKDDEISVLAYDPMIYLLKSSGSFNYKSITIGDYVKKIAASVGLKVGYLADASVKITLEPQIGVNLYEAILDGYTKVKNKTGRIYQPLIGSKSELTVIYSGQVVKNLELANKQNLLNSRYAETIENVINKVIIIDDKGNQIGKVTGDGLSTWGTFQDVYEKEDGKNPTTEAKKLLHGLDREVSVDALGDTRCISGKAVTIKDPQTGLNGLFYIDEDTHIWENGNYTMSLTLNYKNEMGDSA